MKSPFFMKLPRVTDAALENLGYRVVRQSG